MRQSGMRERQAAHSHRLGLRADGVGEIDEPRHENSDCHLGTQRRLEACHDEGGDHAADESDDEPWQAVPGAAQWRCLDRLAGAMALAADAGDAVDVLDVFAAQDVEQGGGRHDAEQPVAAVDHRHGIEFVVQRQRCDTFLIHIGPHARVAALHGLAYGSIGRQRQQHSGGEDADQALVVVEYADQVGALVVPADQARGHFASGLSRMYFGHTTQKVMGGRFAAETRRM